MAKPKPDGILVKDQLAALKAMYAAHGIEAFVNLMIWILTKEEVTFSSGKTGILVPFRFNFEQRIIADTLGKNNLLLKARQIGGTTFFLIVRLVLNAVLTPGTGSLLISQSNEYAEKHFQIARRAHRLFGVMDPYNPAVNEFNQSLMQNLLHTAYSNKREIILDQIESRISIASAETEEVAQGFTLHHIVASEYSRWPRNPEDTLSNARGALIKTGTTDKECTANGAGGAFYEDCLRAMNDPINSDSKFHFFSWYMHEEYSLELSETEKAEMEQDLKEDEIRLIAKMHKELKEVAYLAA
jgi:hypothetical protein